MKNAIYIYIEYQKFHTGIYFDIDNSRDCDTDALKSAAKEILLQNNISVKMLRNITVEIEGDKYYNRVCSDLKSRLNDNNSDYLLDSRSDYFRGRRDPDYFNFNIITDGIIRIEIDSHTGTFLTFKKGIKEIMTNKENAGKLIGKAGCNAKLISKYNGSYVKIIIKD